MIPTITPQMFAGTPFEDTYRRIAPDPDAFPTLVTKLKTLDETPFAWPGEDITGIAAPSLLIVGDADAVRLEHAVAMFRLLGGGAMGDMPEPRSLRRAARHHALHAAGKWDARPRRLASRDDPEFLDEVRSA